MSTIKDSNGRPVTPSVSHDADGWGVTVWMGGRNGLATDVRRYYYATRAQARAASISDAPGDASGRIA